MCKVKLVEHILLLFPAAYINSDNPLLTGLCLQLFLRHVNHAFVRKSDANGLKLFAEGKDELEHWSKGSNCIKTKGAL